MSANTSPIFVVNTTGKGTSWTNSDAANTRKTISPTIGANGSRVHTLIGGSTDTASRDFTIYLNDGTSDYLVGAISLTAGAGLTSGVGSIALASLATNLPWISSDGSFLIPPSWSVKAENATQVTSAKTIQLVMICGDY